MYGIKAHPCGCQPELFYLSFFQNHFLVVHCSICSTDKNKPEGDGGAEVQKQTQGADMSALTASITKLQQEKKQLQKEKDELLAKLATKMTTKGRRLHI